MEAEWSWLGLGWQDKQRGGTNSRVNKWGEDKPGRKVKFAADLLTKPVMAYVVYLVCSH